MWAKQRFVFSVKAGGPYQRTSKGLERYEFAITCRYFTAEKLLVFSHVTGTFKVSVPVSSARTKLIVASLVDFVANRKLVKIKRSLHFGFLKSVSF